MLGWDLGPQREPASLGRLRAQWRQVDVENREARKVRREWMSLLGFSDEEIRQACLVPDLDLADELEDLAAAIVLGRID
jgi:hypothetical protein